jgi:hypothetical protein
MKYFGKEISSLTIQELTNASFKFSAMRKSYQDKLNDPNHEKFKEQPKPTIGENFLELENAINQELKDRKSNVSP